MRRGFPLKLVMVAAVVALVAAGCERDTGGEEGAGQRQDLLAQVIDRDVLRCGVNETVPGFGFRDPDTGDIDGFDIDFCRAFAAATLGDASKIELEPIDADTRFIALRNGQYDVLVRNTTWTTSRDGKEGVAFAHVNFYDGQAMMVRRADNIGAIDELDGADICVTSGTTTELNLADYFEERNLEHNPVKFEDNTQLEAAFRAERCDAWTSDRSQLAGIQSQWPQRFGGPNSLDILPEVMSKEPLAPGVLQAQVKLHDVVDAVTNGLILAEELGVTQANVEEMAESPPSGPIAALLGAPVEDAAGEATTIDHGLGIDNDFMIEVISAVGNYGEIFERNIGKDSPLKLDRGINALWTDNPPGIQYAIPFR